MYIRTHTCTQVHGCIYLEHPTLSCIYVSTNLYVCLQYCQLHCFFRTLHYHCCSMAAAVFLVLRCWCCPLVLSMYRCKTNTHTHTHPSWGRPLPSIALEIVAKGMLNWTLSGKNILNTHFVTAPAMAGPEFLEMVRSNNSHCYC